MKKSIVILICLLMSFPLFGCGGLLPLPMPAPTRTSMPTATPAPTLTHTPTDTPTHTPTPAPTQTPTTTPTPTQMPTPAQTPTLGSIRLKADNSSNSPSLEEAVRRVPDGSTILLDPGTFRLEKPLNIHKPITLIGAGMDETEIVFAGDYVVRFNGDGPFVVEDIAFRQEGSAATNAVEVRGGEVSFSRCRFTGAVYVEGKGGGCGLYLEGQTTGIVQGCEAVDNSAGIVVDGRAHPTLEGNILTDNEIVGITYWGNSGGVARRNDCSRNGLTGIYLADHANPTLEENTCVGNGETGIAYWENSGGVARGNDCSENKLGGIYITDQADPTLEKNVCNDNRRAGIAYLGTSGGVARQNECSGNEMGIYIAETAEPALEDNDCHDNTGEDIQDER